jgi:hypothetical protein
MPLIIDCRPKAKRSERLGTRQAMGPHHAPYANPDRTSSALGSGSRPMNFLYNSAGSSLPNSTVTLLSFWFAVARSGMPSPLKSPTATERGADPTGNGLPAAAVSVPDGFAKLTLTVKLRVTGVAALCLALPP